MDFPHDLDPWNLGNHPQMAFILEWIMIKFTQMNTIEVAFFCNCVIPLGIYHYVYIYVYIYIYIYSIYVYTFPDDVFNIG